MGSEQITYTLSQAKTNSVTVQAKVGNQPSFYLHSRIDPWEEAVEWLKRVTLMPDSLYLVFGAGLAYHVKALAQQLLPNSHIVVILTPTEVEMLRTIRQLPDTDWLADKKVTFLQLSSMRDMAITIANVMIDKMIKKIQVYHHFPAIRLAEREYQQIEESLVPLIEQYMMINFNNAITTNHTFFKNYWSNFLSMLTYPGVKRLAGAFKDIPVIIASAGPSLDRNIEKLKECVGKAVIIASGTAVGALYKQGIIPNFLLVSDASELMYECTRNYLCADTVLVASTTVHPKVVVNYPGPKCFIRTESDISGKLANYLPRTMTVKQTVSVATAAVTFAEYCGARTIIFVGQDLAYPYGLSKQHADGVSASDCYHLDLIKVSGYYGEEVDTNYPFKMVIDFLELYVSQNPQIDFVNATEGGALLPGMRHMDLATVHDNILLKDKIDLKSQIAGLLNYKVDRKAFKQITKEIYRIHDSAQNLAEIINDFIIKEILPDRDRMNAPEGSDIDKFQDFYKLVRTHPVYSWIRTVLDTPIALLKFQLQDGMSMDEEHRYYRELTVELRDILNDFVKMLDEIIKSIEKKKEVFYGRQNHNS